MNSFIQQALGIINVLLPVLTATGVIKDGSVPIAQITAKIESLTNIVAGFAQPNSIENDINDGILLVNTLTDLGALKADNPAVKVIQQFKATEHNFLTGQFAVLGNFHMKDESGVDVHGIIGAVRYDSDIGRELGLS